MIWVESDSWVSISCDGHSWKRCHKSQGKLVTEEGAESKSPQQHNLSIKFSSSLQKLEARLCLFCESFLTASNSRQQLTAQCSDRAKTSRVITWKAYQRASRLPVKSAPYQEERRRNRALLRLSHFQLHRRSACWKHPASAQTQGHYAWLSTGAQKSRH